MLLATLLLVEVGLRIVVTENEQTGIRLLGRVALLPWRPDPEHVEKTLKGRDTADRYIGRDQDLGWSIRPNGRDGLYESNAAGMRGRFGEEVPPVPPPGVTRVAIYGDSFTHGDQVAYPDTWAAQWMGRRANLEVLNFGVPGFGVDQALLRFERDGLRFGAQVHLLCIWPEDIIRNLNVIRFYMTPHGNLGPPKPRFVIDGAGLRLINAPVMDDRQYADSVTGRSISPTMVHDRLYSESDVADRWYHVLYSTRVVGGLWRAQERQKEREQQYFSPDSEANQLAVRIAARFKERAEAVGAKPYVVFIPAANYLDRHASGGWPLVDLLRRNGIDVIDLGPPIADAVRAEGVDRIYQGHTTRLGNQRIAEALDQALADRKVRGFH